MEGDRRTGRRREAVATEAELAHLRRRLGFGAFPGQVEADLELDLPVHDHIDRLIDVPPIPWDPPVDIDRPYAPEQEKELGTYELVRHWLDRMGRDDAALHERMMWFWHTLFTTSAEKGIFTSQWRQVRKLHRLATGTLGELAATLVVDPAMMWFLDSEGSTIEAPNENLGRELMELFLLGEGHYTEDDVRAAARALSGWRISTETWEASLVPGTGPTEPDTFLGTTAVFDPDSLVARILEHPECAPHTVRKVWRAFIGGAPDEALVAGWADRFRRSGYEILPLLREVLHSDPFLASRNTVPKRGLDWFVGVVRAAGIEDWNGLHLAQLGQVPFYPPNVSGWPEGATWVSSASQFTRAAFLDQYQLVPPDVPADERIVDATLHWCGLYDVTDQTVEALGRLADDLRTHPDDTRRVTVLAAALMSPEYAYT